VRTMGMLLVASLAAAATSGPPGETITSTLSRTQFAHSRQPAALA
jgi:hypothetical protein